jgi:hypothetical protein
MDFGSTQIFSFLDFLRRRRFSTRAENKPMSASPKILIVGLESWAGVARLPHALQDAGFEVGVACFEDNYLAATRFRDRFFRGARVAGAVAHCCGSLRPSPTNGVPIFWCRPTTPQWLFSRGVLNG